MTTSSFGISKRSVNRILTCSRSSSSQHDFQTGSIESLDGDKTDHIIRVLYNRYICTLLISVMTSLLSLPPSSWHPHRIEYARSECKRGGRFYLAIAASALSYVSKAPFLSLYSSSTSGLVGDLSTESPPLYPDRGASLSEAATLSG